MFPVVVNADDLGISPGVNRAILAGLDEGWLSDASVLATGPGFAEIRGDLRGRKLGFHADVCEFPPLRGALPERKRLDYPPRALPALIAELSAQVERLLDAGLTITHADSHQHMHYQIVILEALLSVARSYQIPFVRPVSSTPPIRRRRYIRRQIVELRAAAAGISMVDGFGPAERVQAALLNGWRPKSLEVMCHPGVNELGYSSEIAWLRTNPFAEFGGSVVPYVTIR